MPRAVTSHVAPISRPGARPWMLTVALGAALLPACQGGPATDSDNGPESLQPESEMEAGHGPVVGAVAEVDLRRARARSGEAGGPRLSGLIPLGLNEQGLPEYELVLRAEPDLVTLDLVLLPAGVFSMGTLAEDGASTDEGPVRDVAVSSFLMARTEVTLRQWEAVMGPRPGASDADGELPVSRVTFDEAHAFCERLSLRLPSESEWEYAACSGGSGSPEATTLSGFAWFLENSEDRPHAVGLKRPNAFGLHDLQGNLAEWCQDVWQPGYDDAPSDGSPRLLEGTASEDVARVLRGGSYLDGANNCRPSARWGLGSNLALDSVGFRPARTP